MQVQERLSALSTALKHLADHKEGKAGARLNKALENLQKTKVGWSRPALTKSLRGYFQHTAPR